MLSQVTLKISSSLFTRAKQLAQGQSEQSAAELVDVLDQILAAAEHGEIELDQQDDEAEDDTALQREMQAYIAMHPQLKKTHYGKHVAIYESRLIDSDGDYDALTRRIDDKYPDQFVWISTVEDEPIKTIVFRSPRLEPVAS
ncbi:MAG: hypothetical protein R2911_40615 [Caldilineaceae bacterium]